MLITYSYDVYPIPCVHSGNWYLSLIQVSVPCPFSDRDVVPLNGIMKVRQGRIRCENSMLHERFDAEFSLPFQSVVIDSRP